MIWGGQNADLGVVRETENGRRRGQTALWGMEGISEGEGDPFGVGVLYMLARSMQ